MTRVEKQLFTAAIIIFLYLVVGTWLFSWQEGWRPFDSFYFSAMTLTTVGYGDFTPTTDISKLATVFFGFSGISIIFYSLSIFAREYFEHQEDRFERLRHMPGDFLRKGSTIPKKIINHVKSANTRNNTHLIASAVKKMGSTSKLAGQRKKR